MSNLTYRDIPLLRSAGFHSSSGGYVWSKTDNEGREWAVLEAEDSTSPLLVFVCKGGGYQRMTRTKFQELFE